MYKLAPVTQGWIVLCFGTIQWIAQLVSPVQLSVGCLSLDCRLTVHQQTIG